MCSAHCLAEAYLVPRPSYLGLVQERIACWPEVEGFRLAGCNSRRGLAVVRKLDDQRSRSKVATRGISATGQSGALRDGNAAPVGLLHAPNDLPTSLLPWGLWSISVSSFG